MGLVAVGLLAAGCGSSSRSVEPLITSDRVQALLYRGGEPRHIAGLIPLGQLLTPNPYGDLDDYEFDHVTKAGEPDPFHPAADLAVFRTVKAARAASIAIHRGGPCDAHPSQNKKFITLPGLTCEHFRVGNVLLIVYMKNGEVVPAIKPRDRQALLSFMQKLGESTQE